MSFVVRCSSLVLLLVTGLFVSHTQAAVIILGQEVGGNVLISYSGTVNTADLTLSGGYTGDRLLPTTLEFSFNASNPRLVGAVTSNGYGSIGSAGPTSPDEVNGDSFYINYTTVGVSDSYISGSPIVGTMSFLGTTLAELGIPSSAALDYFWGSGATLDSASFRVVPPSAVPLPAAAWLFISAIAGLAGAKRLSRSKGSA